MNNFVEKVKRESRVDPTTGDLSYVYTYKRKRCPKTEIKSELAKKYIGYDLIRHDLECAKNWIHQAYRLLPARGQFGKVDAKDKFLPIKDKDDESIIMALFISSITYYGKCFTAAKGRGIKLDKRFVPENYQEKHEIIMEYRHTIAAHSGKGDWDAGRLMLIKSPSKKKPDKPFIWSELKMLSFYDDRDDMYSYVNLINELQHKIKEKSDHLAELILKDVNG